MKKAFILTITLFAASLAFASVQEDKTLFESACGTCHSLERSLRTTKNLMAWKRTIKRMNRYANGRISETEADKIAEYVITSYSIHYTKLYDYLMTPGILQFCLLLSRESFR